VTSVALNVRPVSECSTDLPIDPEIVRFSSGERSRRQERIDFPRERIPDRVTPHVLRAQNASSKPDRLPRDPSRDHVPNFSSSSLERLLHRSPRPGLLLHAVWTAETPLLTR
jgi:hypothetical protein